MNSYIHRSRPLSRSSSGPRLWLGLLCSGLITSPLWAQSDQSASAAGQAVVLPQFTVDTSKDTGYIGSDSLSATRAAMPTIDMPSSITVLTRQFMDDTAVFSAAELAHYVSGVSDGQIPGQDGLGIYIRGFSPTVATDGFVASAEGTDELADIERVEILKGPSAVLFAQSGSAGGVVDRITKSPLDTQQGYLRVQAGMFDGNRVEFDTTGPVPGTGKMLLYRFIVSGQDSDGYLDNMFTKRLLIAPSFTVRFSDTSYITVKYEYFNNKQTQDVGVPLDQYVDQTNEVIAVFPVPPTRTVNDPNDVQHAIRNKVDIAAGTQLSAHFRADFGFQFANVNYERQYTRPYATPDLVLADGTVPREWGQIRTETRYYRLYQDDVVDYKFKWFSSNTMFGGEALDSNASGYTQALEPFYSTNIYSVPVADPIPVVNQPWLPESIQQSAKIYGLEQIKAFNDHLILEYGLTRNWLSQASYNTTTASFPFNNSAANVKQYGIVVRPITAVSLYYGYDENFSPNFQLLGVVEPNGSIVQTGIAPPKLTISNEEGMKIRFLDGKIQFNVDHFQEELTNVTQLIIGSALYTLIGGGSSKGWETDMFFQATKELSIVASASDVNALQQNGLPFGYAAQYTSALWARYNFDPDTILKNLGFSVGMDYSGQAYNYNGSIQKSEGGRVLWSTGLYYTWKPLSFQVNCTNLFDKYFIAGGYLPTRVYIGDGRNVKGSITYHF